MSAGHKPSIGPSPLKRRYEPESNSDSENVDPASVASPLKKCKSGHEDFYKRSNVVLKTVAAPLEKPLVSKVTKSPQPTKPRVTGIRSKSIRGTSPLRNKTASGAAGKKSNKGIGSARRNATRVNPPTGGVGALPFSIDAALSGTVPAYTVDQDIFALGKSKDSLKFEIYEDTKEEYMGNIVEHATCILDISDDECRDKFYDDGSNKENVAPPDHMGNHSTGNQVPITRKNMMTDEPRSPLGDLEAAIYYAEGCDADSKDYFDGDDDDEVQCSRAKKEAVQFPKAAKVHNFSLPSQSAVAPEPEFQWKYLLSQLEMKQILNSFAGSYNIPVSQEPPPIEIWESESAKEDDSPTPPDESQLAPSWVAVGETQSLIIQQ
ncbi:hypothetical protein MMC31_004041 [Peltigera leucophlebia]|nr:hypothetical protein [Peltigera leucophlebia]